MIIALDPEAFEDFRSWASEGKKIFAKISDLIEDATRTPFQRLGKPEPLKHELKGFWSRRITDEHRLVYKVEKDTLYIASRKQHY